MLASRLKRFLESDRMAAWRRRLTRLAGYGTAGYPPSVRRRLRILNVAAYLIATFNLIYALQQVVLDYQTWKPVILINLVLTAIALSVPFLHRFNEVAGALTLAISENIGLFVLTYILGTESGLHIQYFAAVAGYFLVLGLGRLKLILGLILGGLALHLVAWAWFTQERALLRVRPYDLDDLYVTAVVTTSTVVAVVVYYAFRLAEQAQEETDTLLHNILPTSIVDRLKGAPGATIADELPDASVLFADLKGFVPLAKSLGPARTVGLLNIVVSAFDDLADQWQVEKIKTIGDAYMAAAGLPEPVPDHADRLAGMALAMQATLARIAREQKVALALRIGIATGPVLAGVIGARRLTYDVWGDTVNLASRLEGQSQPGRVLVSRATKAQLEHSFALERCGSLELKGYGLEEAWYVLEALQADAQPRPAARASAAGARSA
jgi:adenylate cyclase